MYLLLLRRHHGELASPEAVKLAGELAAAEERGELAAVLADWHASRAEARSPRQRARGVLGLVRLAGKRVSR